MKQNLQEEKLAAGLAAQRKYGDLKMRHLPTDFSTFIEEVPHIAARIPGIISSLRRSSLGEKEKKREGTRLATTSLVSRRSFTARCYTQFKLLSDQGANIHHSELALAVFTPGLLRKRQIKNTSFHFIASQCIFSGLNQFFFFFSPTPSQPVTLRPITISHNELQSKPNAAAALPQKKKKSQSEEERRGHLT